MAGPRRSADITPLHCYSGPSRHPLVFGRLPGFAGYTAYLAPTISRRDEEGFSSCSACPCHRAVTSTPPRWTSVSVSLRLLMQPSPSGWRLGPRGYSFSRPQRVHFYYGPVTRSLPWGDFVDRLQSFSFHHLCYPNYGALTSTPAGLSPAEHASLRWTHNWTCRFPASSSPTGFTARHSAWQFGAGVRDAAGRILRGQLQERTEPCRALPPCAVWQGSLVRAHRHSGRQPG